MLAAMASPTALECLRCRRRYPVVQMPGGCPSCSAEDCPSNVAPVYSRMQSLKPGKLSGDGLHRYAAQLPIPRERLVSLGEGSTPLVSIGTLGREFGLRRLMIKDERRNPTGSWRDRFSALAVSEHAGADATVGTAGGDAMAMSMAAYAARAGLRSVALVDAALEEGGRVLDAIEWVGGRAVGVSGLEARWTLVADEVGGAVASSLAGGKDWVAPSGDVHSLARSLGGITGTVQTLQAVIESEGLVVRVTDAELETARIVLGESEGVWAELGAAAGLAAAQKLSSRGDIPARAHFVAVVTEHGLLDEMAQVPPMLETVDARVDELLRVLAVRGE